MDKLIARDQWHEFCKEFNKRNFHRCTRLQTLDGTGSRLEEEGLPFEGIDLDTRDDASPCIEIMLGDEKVFGERHLCHNVGYVRQITAKVGQDGQDQVLEIEAIDNVRTLIHFTDLPVLPE